MRAERAVLQNLDLVERAVDRYHQDLVAVSDDGCADLFAERKRCALVTGFGIQGDQVAVVSRDNDRAVQMRGAAPVIAGVLVFMHPDHRSGIAVDAAVNAVVAAAPVRAGGARVDIAVLAG